VGLPLIPNASLLASQNFDIRISDFFLVYLIKNIVEVWGGFNEERKIQCCGGRGHRRGGK